MSLTFQPSASSVGIYEDIWGEQIIPYPLSYTFIILSPSIFKPAITLMIKCSIRGNLSTGLSLMVRWMSFWSAKTPYKLLAFYILLLWRYRICNFASFYKPIFIGIFEIWLWDRSNFIRFTHLCTNSSSSVTISFPDKTNILSFYGATIFLFKNISFWGSVFFFWIYIALTVKFGFMTILNNQIL